MAKITEATITISGWGETRTQAVINLAIHLLEFADILNKHEVPSEFDGVKFSECEEVANYAGIYTECPGCQYRIAAVNGDIDCLWNPARNPSGCAVENNKKEIR
jgi:hypothetical protein